MKSNREAKNLILRNSFITFCRLNFSTLKLSLSCRRMENTVDGPSQAGGTYGTASAGKPFSTYSDASLFPCVWATEYS